MIANQPHFVRGDLFNLTRISQNENQIMLVMDMSFDFKGKTVQQ